MAAALDGCAGVERERRRVGVAVRRHQRDGDDDHADVHDHAAVGPADEAAPALPAGGQHHLAQRRRRRRTRRGRTPRSGASPSAPTSTATHERADAAPRRPEQPLAEQLAAAPCATAAPGRRPSGTAATSPIGIDSRSKYGAPTTIWRSCSASTSSGNTVPSSTTKANTVNSTLLARNAPSRDSGESIAPGERRRSPRQAISAERHDDDDAEERQQVRRRPGRRRTRARSSITPERVRNVPRIVSANVAHEQRSGSTPATSRAAPARAPSGCRRCR